MIKFNKLCLCIGMLAILLGLLPYFVSADGETELPLFNTLPMEIGAWSEFAVSPDGKILFSGGGDNSYLWHLDSGRNKEIEELRNESFIDDAAFSPEGKLLAVAIYGNSTNRVMLIDSQSGNLIDTIEISGSGYVGPISFSHDGKLLITGIRWDRLSIIDMTSNKEVYDIPYDAYIHSIRTNPVRNEFAVANSYSRGSNSKDLQIRNTGTGEIIKALGNTLPSGDCEILDMNYSPNGSYLIISFNKICGSLVYDADNKYEQVAVLDHGGRISYSKDSKLAIIGDHVYPIADKFKSSYGLKMKNSNQKINPQLAILSPDGKYFITTSSDGLVVLDASGLSIYLVEIRIEPNVITLGLNESKTLEIKGIFSDGTSKTLDAHAVNWTVKDFYMAEVKENVLFGLSNGSTELTVEYGGFKKTVPIIVADYPSKLSATETEGNVNLTWTGVSKTKELIGYHLYRRTANESYGDMPLTDFPIETTNYTDSNVNNDLQYYYIVKAVYKSVESGPSNEVTPMPIANQIVLQIDNPIMQVNGSSKEIDPGNGTTPVMYKGRTVLPIRALIDELGGQLAWEDSDQKIDINLNGIKIELWINKHKAIVDGNELSLDVPPVIINGRTMVPLRFIGENLGLQLIWNGTMQTVELIN